MSTAKVIIDSNSLQAQAHLIDKLRLRTFIEAVRKGAKLDVEFSHQGQLGNHLTKEYLLNDEECKLLIITTRPPNDPNLPNWSRPFQYSENELNDIQEFVNRGGSLLLMSNHSDTSRNPTDWREEDNRLSEKFNIKLDQTCFTIRGTLTGLLTNFDNPTYPIVKGIDTIVVNNCFSISGSGGFPVAFLNESMKDAGPYGQNPHNKVFAYAIDRKEIQDGIYSGRVIIVADSGFIGEVLTTRPGPGLIECGDNYQFVVNMIQWLLQE